MKRTAIVAIVAIALASVGHSASAAPTLNLNLTTKPTPGQQTVVQATLTGSHIVYYGPGAVRPGTIHWYANGQEFGSADPSVGNSTGSSCGSSGDSQLPIICFAPTTLIGMKYTFPAGAASTVSFTAHFDGDADTSSSTSPPLVANARFSSTSAIVNLILGD